jgi:hypothetical protein
MSKSAKKQSPRLARIEATAATLSPQPMPKSNRTDKAEVASKQSRVIAMLQSPTGGDDCRHDRSYGLAAAFRARLCCVGEVINSLNDRQC